MKADGQQYIISEEPIKLPSKNKIIVRGTRYNDRRRQQEDTFKGILDGQQFGYHEFKQKHEEAKVSEINDPGKTVVR